jgi:hypothetical protein
MPARFQLKGLAGNMSGEVDGDASSYWESAGNAFPQ